MTNTVTNIVEVVMPHFEGYAYPNEATQQPLWSVLIVLYPYITGLVAGAFIMASLVRVFDVKPLEPVYRLSLLTAFAFLLCAPLPLLFHLGHPERCFEVMMTPHLTSPMAIFGFVYAWYLMAVLLLELWFDYRRDFVAWSESTPGFQGMLYRLFTVGVTDDSEEAVRLDHKYKSAYLNMAGIDVNACPVQPHALGEMLGLLKDGTLSGKMAKEVFEAMCESGKAAKDIVAEKGLGQISDTGALEAIVARLVEANPGPAAEFRQGRDKVLGFFVGQVMKETKGQANPAVVNDLLRKHLQKA